jgi:hypothetical protein
MDSREAPRRWRRTWGTDGRAVTSLLSLLSAGRGVATATVRKLCRLAAAQNGLRTLTAATTGDNVASQKVADHGPVIRVRSGEPDRRLPACTRPGSAVPRRLRTARLRCRCAIDGGCRADI